ncbi:flagellar basal body rod protein FlgF [Paludibacterium purpuratum]|uniref:Flagellar basal-body rod protein FlgF n=1 Tax=Paludibacterium purpuratum TaxID=1144873 RepID=A0A4R7B5H1_9NEIS|nr:flagellar basal body rod protein FlgF [Paludibacterium purpuratum]TDR79914.1 flagellar basal-body rod protein FlgF [Paludibacterium purpuratum]
MDRMLFLAMNGAKHVEWQQATTSNNLANVNTNGFKAEQVSFRALPVIGDGAPTRTYVVDNTVGTDMTQGALQQTGNQNDFALGTPGFFAVQAPDGTEAYSRAGGYVIDNAGTLRTRSGLPILGDGGPIVAPAASKVQIMTDGSVVAIPLGESNPTPQTLGQIKLVNPGERTMYKGEDGLFRMNDGSTPQADQNVKVVVGSLEASNVNAVDSLVQMISHGRMFEMNVKLMTTAEQNDQQATQLLSMS